VNDTPSPQPAEEYAGVPEGSLQTPTLTALRELLDVAVRVRPTIARRAELSTSELQTLELLFDGGIGPAELARRLGVTTAAVSGIVDRLEGRGHVVRSPHASDGRRTEVAITGSGAAEVMSHLVPMFRSLQEMDDRLSPADREVVEAYLRGAVAALRQLL
jgi:DNA-binding MarR family transcriptional regulator